MLKAVFVSGFLTYLMLAAVYALLQMARGMEPLLSWFGMALAALGPLAFFAGLYLFQPARTERHPVEYSIICGLGVAISMTLSWRFGDSAGLIHLWAGLSLLGWVAYLRWYSPYGQRPAGPLATGLALPEFHLRTLEGETINSSLFRGRPHILVFIRGNWCPFCMGQVRELEANWQDLEDAGARVVVISPQPLEHQQKLARRFKAPMQFFQDTGNRAATDLGLAVRSGLPLGLQALGYGSDTVMPTVIITDEAGRIVYSALTDNYRIRPEPSDLIAVLEELDQAADAAMPKT